MSGRRQIFLAARREILERGRSRAFLASTVIQLIVVLGVIVVSGLTADDDTETYRVGAVGDRAVEIVDEASRISEGLGVEIDGSQPGEASEAREAVAADDLDALVTDDALTTGQSPPAGLVAALQGAARNVNGVAALEREGVERSAAERALNPPPLAQDTVGEGETDSAIGFIAALFLYIAILSFGLVVATGVVEEKSSRVIEMVLTAVRASRLLAGKVIGIGLLGLAQLLLIAGIAVGVALALGQVELPDTTLPTLALVVAYFILGYGLYSCLFASGGALVSRQEDIGSATTPLTIILVIGYIVSFQTAENPDSGLAVFTSLFPLTSPIVAPTRIATDAMPPSEVIASLVLLAVAILAAIWLATRIYERTILRVGAPLKLGQALRLLRERD
ncbi:ABC transporter permease [Thermoleophilia bacterium SCSIO 60948]|nr:ABC transporter permease [Thermoleophilia bacterium SCSIO 60948]